VHAPRDVSGPLPAGARVGTVTVDRDGRRVRSVPLVTAASVPEAGLVRKAWSLLRGPAAVLVVGIAALLIVRRRRRTLTDRRHPAPAPERTG
jgi:serine-type D-Ala-D-Ala carboxypeptidase (penicillin-binding protein 5/6)